MVVRTDVCDLVIVLRCKYSCLFRHTLQTSAQWHLQIKILETACFSFECNLLLSVLLQAKGTKL